MKTIKISLIILSIIYQPMLFADWASQSAYHLTNQNPFVQIHGISGYSGANVISAGHNYTHIQLNISNEFHQQAKTGEQILLDYERTKLDFIYEHGIRNGWSAGISVPYIKNSGGFLDSVIENWHDLFGLPQGGRDNAERDQFMISFENGNNGFFTDNKDQGIGDISVYLDKQLFKNDVQKLKARLKLKLPTGDEDQLFGSGGYALAFDVNGLKQFSSAWQGYGALGINYLEDSDVLPDQQKKCCDNGDYGCCMVN